MGSVWVPKRIFFVENKLVKRQIKKKYSTFSNALKDELAKIDLDKSWPVNEIYGFVTQSIWESVMFSCIIVQYNNPTTFAEIYTYLFYLSHEKTLVTL